MIESQDAAQVAWPPAPAGVARATARLQLHREFGFAQVGELLDYYDTLGVSHLYLSPILVARPGSPHGYDVVDPTQVNPELGGQAGLRQLCGQLRERGMGLVLDIVPNHMAVGRHNPWWQDVLCWGLHSPYADWFDIDWASADPVLTGKLLLPFLGQAYGQALEAGELSLQLDAQLGQLQVAHYEHRFPLAPRDYAAILQSAGSQRLAPIIKLFAGLDADHQRARAQAQAGWQMLREMAGDVDGMADIDAALAAFSVSQPHGREQLHQLLERQHYRLAFWRNAADEINWRRFFEVSELVGMRIEREDVFEAMHAEIFRLYAEGLIDGLRLDHIDGLVDPGAYCRRLRERLLALRADHTPYIIAEKILAPGEHLRADWQLDGTTGYEFMDQCAALLHDAAGAPVLDRIWHDIVAQLSRPGQGPGQGQEGQFEAIVREARRSLLTRNFAAEFNALVQCLHQLARAAATTRDLSSMSIRRSLGELLVHFPNYRTYATAEGMSAAERETLACAVIAAAAALHPGDHATLHVIEGWLGADLLTANTEERRRSLQLRAIARFQQLTPPLTAKSVEDTAFYRYGRLLSRNEVGSDPSQLGLSLQQFHHLAQWRAQHAPRSLLATATHDHKRGEDARMRLAVLSEIAEEWHTLLHHWRQLNAPIAQATAGQQGAIEASDECMLYQTLVGAWPDAMQALSDDLQPLQQLALRVTQWQRKALREAKRRSDWLLPQEDYEQACERFANALLCDPGLDPRHHPFLLELEQFVRRIAPIGALNSLTQTMLKLCTPGIPDFYQGTELWDLSLVDPDNRSAVDFAGRQRLLADVTQRPVSLRQWQDGASKQQLIHAVLAYRRQHAALFANGTYWPLAAHGRLAAHVIAFARVLAPMSASIVDNAEPNVPGQDAARQVVIVVCTRLAAGLLSFEGPRDEALPLVPAEAWEDTVIAIPADLLADPASQRPLWRSVLTSGHGQLPSRVLPDGDSGPCLALGEVLGSLPVELIALDGGEHP